MQNITPRLLGVGGWGGLYFIVSVTNSIVVLFLVSIGAVLLLRNTSFCTIGYFIFVELSAVLME